MFVCMLHQRVEGGSHTAHKRTAVGIDGDVMCGVYGCFQTIVCFGQLFIEETVSVSNQFNSIASF